MAQPIAPAMLTLPSGEPAMSAWPLRRDVIHLNHGSYGGVPRIALEHQEHLRAEMEEAPVPWFARSHELLQEARNALAPKIGAPVDKTVLVPNASAGASVVYNSITLDMGAEIVVTNHGYGAVTMGAERLARRIGGAVVTATVPLTATADEAVDAVMVAVTARTGLVILDQICSPSGMRLPVVDLSRLLRAQGIKVLVDAAHAPGLIDNPLEGLIADYWVGNLHKYACAPRGTALMVAQGDDYGDMYPLIDSWGAPFDFPERFDHQGTLDYTSYLAAVTSWEFIDDTWGWQTVREYSRSLVDYGEAIVAQAFSDITGEDHHAGVKLTNDALRIIRLPGSLVKINDDANAVRNYMFKNHGVHISVTCFEGQGYLRLSAHAYNTAADYEEFAQRAVPALSKLAREADAGREWKQPTGVSA